MTGNRWYMGRSPNTYTWMIVLLWLVGLSLIQLSGQEQGYAATALRRFALIAGSNDGGPERVRLLYAASDARAFEKVMQELGGVGHEDSLLLVNPGIKEMNAGLKKIKEVLAMSAGNKQRQEFIFYYSGHSDEEGLLLGNEKYPYKQIRENIAGVPANVRIVILDSCSSGALTRTKGGVRQPAFLLDAASEMKGQAILTSSAYKEAAQESDALKASFFTHYLVSGLRGAADATGDGMVTLNEAYHYAFKETLASTEKTQLGPQHPAYDINLSGTGDLVLTDLREATARVLVASTISGRIFFRDEKGLLAVELAKQPGQVMQLGLVPGRYQVVVDSPTGTLACELTVNQATETRLDPGLLKPFKGRLYTARGSSEASELPEAGSSARTEAGLENDISVPKYSSHSPNFSKFRFTLVPGVVFPRIARQSESTLLALGLIISSEENIRALQLSALVNVVQGELTGWQASGLGNNTGGNTRGVQGAGIFNKNTGSVNGVQAAGIFNVTGAEHTGIQAAGIFNQAGGQFTGLQGAGIFNKASGPFTGLQAAGIFNLSDHSHTGMQASGIISVTAGTFTGLQASGIFNVAQAVQGCQAGLINVTSGKVKGLQVGLINVCDDIDGLPLGLINFVRKGQHGLDVWLDTNNFVHTGFRLGSRHFYTLLTGSYLVTGTSPLWSAGIGYGTSLCYEEAFINLDALNSFYFDTLDLRQTFNRLRFLPEARLTVGVKLFSVINLFGGCAAQFLIPKYSPDLKAGSYAAVEEYDIRPVFYAGLGIF